MKAKPHQQDLASIPAQPAAARRRRKARTPASRRRLLLIDYQAWIDLTAQMGSTPAAAEQRRGA
ncbi:hypothetical protein [Variovorax rhizosphaerae]|uniref:Uncharacterized protein n=1 Tax=Variovorax rhizosphaerae TaxID=1836200 RepID=A0ABU8WWR4_9BURK